jgi:putative hemolysin
MQLNNGDNLQAIPREGPLLIVANHPLGGLEGVALASLVAAIRPDLKVLTNELLCRIPEFAGMFIGVDVLSRQAAAKNVRGVKRVHAHLKQGGALLIFPAGLVATYEMKHRAIVDRPWDRLVGQLVRRHRCACLPVHVGGRNSAYFYAAGFIHRRLRTAFLPRQLLNKQGYRLPLTFGSLIPYQELAAMDNPRTVTEYLRINTEALGRQETGGHRQRQQQALADLPADQTREQLQQSIGTLSDCRLVEHRDFDVYCAPYDRLGALMGQLAIARELTFRTVGEGTGHAADSDRYDPSYLHLFLWDRAACRVAGAYRIGLVDQIVAEQGVKGLYTRSLYRYNQAFIRQLGSAIEMGRSFIHPDYQRRPVALNLLWRGIGEFLNRHPQYHTLFGSVDISRDYTDLARALIADTLLTNYQADDFQALVRPTRPQRIRHRLWTRETLSALANIKTLSKLIGRCDPGKAVPVLLRHYLALNGRLVCFNVDPNRSDTLGGLIIVDLRQCDSKTAIRFMGEAGYNRFLEIHSLSKSA